MSEDRRMTDWSDERLASAFAARASRAHTPEALASETFERAASRRRGALARPKLAWLAGVAAGLALVAVIGVGTAVAPGPAALRDTPSANPGDPPLISVTDAIGIRDAGFDDREIAVWGWYAPPGPLPCPASLGSGASANPTRPSCPMTLTWLMEQREQVAERTASSITGIHPDGPALNPSLALVDATILPTDAEDVVEAVLIGHFDDRRAEFCSEQERNACADTFVVDRVGRLEGRDVPTLTVRDLAHEDASTGISRELDLLNTEKDIDAAIRRVDPRLEILSRRAVAIERLGSTEPVYAGASGRDSSFVSTAAWLVVALPAADAGERTVARTFMIPDGTVEAITEITRGGPVPISSASSPAPTDSPSAAEGGSSTLYSLIGDPITVAEALDHRDGHLDDTEIAVHGSWVSPPLRCGPRIELPTPLESGCGPGRFFDESPIDPNGLDEPNGPELQPLLDPPAFVAPTLGLTAKDAVEVIAIGHFNDRRAGSCRANGCEFIFVVDALLDPSNPVVDLKAIEEKKPLGGITPIAEARDVERLVTGARRGAMPVFAASAVAPDVLVAWEPTARSSPELMGADAIWIVRYIDTSEEGPPVLKTELVIDGPMKSLSGSTYVPTREGLMIETTIID